MMVSGLINAQRFKLLISLLNFSLICCATRFFPSHHIHHNHAICNPPQQLKRSFFRPFSFVPFFFRFPFKAISLSLFYPNYLQISSIKPSCESCQPYFTVWTTHNLCGARNSSTMHERLSTILVSRWATNAACGSLTRLAFA